ncbi:hypothetical protein HK100_008976 [Physocladia obscura]|uniref:G-protein coupled receptors family 1 profile domain-containing protein n=1 Tax=Physocladia obscura TaxID=109957 RepID=A0AAD5SNQ9_9FUNG|nr:hypothetical protein HK100_008976 [Physocladia obscura]
MSDQIESPNTDSEFWAIYLLYTPTAIFGAMLSGPMLLTILTNRARLLKNTLDRIALLLLFVSFTWSLWTFLKVVLMLLVSNDRVNQANAALTYISVVWFLFSNVFLAMSRYFLFKQWTQNKTRTYFMSGLIIAVVLSAGLIWVFSTAATTNSFVPFPAAQYKTQTVVMFIIGAFTVVFSMSAITGLYVATYILISRNLSVTMPSSSESQIRLRLQNRLLKSMILMSSGIVVCYLPITIALIRKGFLNGGSLSLFPAVIVTEFVILDTVVTPAMLLYFFPKIRYTLAEKWKIFRILSGRSFSFDTEVDLED